MPFKFNVISYDPFHSGPDPLTTSTLSADGHFCSLGNAVLTWDTIKSLANNFFALIKKTMVGLLKQGVNLSLSRQHELK